MLGTYVALLRGVNVGGNSIIRMARLRETFEGLGFRSVSTYINSGNVLFQTDESDPRKLESRIEKSLVRDHKLGCRIVIRDVAAMEKLVKSLPKTWTGTDWQQNVIFLRHTIDSKQILRSLDPKPDIEEVAYHPGTLLWRARRSALTRSTMLKLSRQPIYQEMTVRNPNTVRKLYDLMKRMSASPTS